MEIIKNFLYPCKNDILDPLSVVIKLFIYSYKPLGTKISVLNNKLIIQENNYFQSTIRSINRDTKNDLINILYPLTYACELYLNELYRDKYKDIFEKIIISVDKLKEVYQLTDIKHSIEQLKNIINSFLLNSNFDPKTILSDYNDSPSILKQNFYKQINSIWTTTRLDILFGHITEITKPNNTEDVQEYLLISLNAFMNYIDLLVEKMLENFHLGRY